MYLQVARFIDVYMYVLPIIKHDTIINKAHI